MEGPFLATGTCPQPWGQQLPWSGGWAYSCFSSHPSQCPVAAPLFPSGKSVVPGEGPGRKAEAASSFCRLHKGSMVAQGSTRLGAFSTPPTSLCTSPFRSVCLRPLEQPFSTSCLPFLVGSVFLPRSQVRGFLKASVGAVFSYQDLFPQRPTAPVPRSPRCAVLR